ncbi:hypothetical protein [Actinoplanes aureus]|uniref:Uncharacterized protein n=1 Tax=Actinoplanes aureus TaxID=2792083 RepID=A0A931CM47_9ACTN|nr:hypothetical protein [Actinoplanes aureus]MBG0568803.1 hypothetical protein [Actinoplanes aureus]
MDLEQLVPDINVFQRHFQAMELAEEEITKAVRTYPHAEAHIQKSFTLLRPADLDLLRSTDVYRAHCRELLHRVATGADTRPGTAAECCLALAEISRRVPLNTSAAGLYARMWKQAGLPQAPLADAAEHYEAITATTIDEFEAQLRSKLAQPWRQ